MDALKVYSSTIYKKDIRYLNPLFNRLEQHSMPETERNCTTTEEIGKDGAIIIKETPTPFESAVYNE